MSQLATADELRAHADNIEAKAFDFLDKNGRIALSSGAQWVSLRITFIDGTMMTVARKVFESEFMGYQFKLRPARDNA